MVSKEQMAKLLNRSLTTAEDTNYKLYLKIASQRLEELLCMSLCSDGDGSRTYQSRKGYRALYTDPFISIDSVTINGEEVSADDYTIKQFDKFSGSWYNIIEFDRVRSGQKVVVSANWGFDSCPYDLQLLLAKLFDYGSVEQTQDNQVKSKKIEDFTVTYKDSATYDELVTQNSAVIDKYSLCNQGYVRNGNLRPVYNY